MLFPLGQAYPWSFQPHGRPYTNIYKRYLLCYLLLYELNAVDFSSQNRVLQPIKCLEVIKSGRKGRDVIAKVFSSFRNEQLCLGKHLPTT